MNTVLIVDDERRIRQEMKAAVQHSGVPVRNIMECGNGREALEILESQMVDVMFTDIRMPELNGIELAEAMQRLEHKPLTVAVSGYDDFTYAVQMLRLGIREYILKPIEREQIVSILGKLEEEIQRNGQRERLAREIGCQQLKYMIWNENIMQKEIWTVTQWLEEQLLTQEYVVCCREPAEEETEENRSYLCLGRIEESVVYIVGRKNRDFLLKNELRDSYVGVSGVHCGAEELKAAYREAKSARIEAFLKAEHEVQYHKEPARTREKPEEERIGKIAQMIGANKISEALKMVERFFAEIKRGRYCGDALEQSTDKLIHEILHIYRNVLQESEKDLIRFRNIYQFAQIDELMEELAAWIIEFHEKVGPEFEDYKNKSQMRQAVAYIRENYGNDLNMAVVSNYVSMNYSLFSYAFKQYTGKNFVNYLKELRVNEAKRLLIETDMRVMEISQQVGYENEKHFMKIFKSISGVSPTEYRKNMQFREL